MNNHKIFAEKFVANYEYPHHDLRGIPVYLVNDPNIGVYGAVQYLLLETKQTQPKPQTKRRSTKKKAS